MEPKLKIDVLVPRDKVNYDTSTMSLWRMINYTQEKIGASFNVPPLARSALVHEARNRAVNMVRDDADYVLMVDDDMAVQYPETLVDMLEAMDTHGFDVVTPLTCKRSFPILLATSKLTDYNGTLRSTPVSITEIMAAENEGKDIAPITPVLGGGAFLLMRARALTAAMRAHLDAKDWVLVHDEQFTRMGIGRGVVEQERRYISNQRWQDYNLNKHHTLFNFPYNGDCTYLNGEDWQFTLFHYQLGFPTALLPSIMVEHIGEFPFSPRMFGITHWKDLVVPGLKEQAAKEVVDNIVEEEAVK